MDNRRLARWGETIAARFLSRRGAVITSRNRRFQRDEVDLVVVYPNRVRAVVEVKTRLSADPVGVIHPNQAARLAGRARQLGIDRVDLCAVRPTPDGVWIHWIPHIS